MSQPTWSLKGPHFANCNCDYGCPCQFNARSGSVWFSVITESKLIPSVVTPLAPVTSEKTWTAPALTTPCV